MQRTSIFLSHLQFVGHRKHHSEDLEIANLDVTNNSAPLPRLQIFCSIGLHCDRLLQSM